MFNTNNYDVSATMGTLRKTHQKSFFVQGDASKRLSSLMGDNPTYKKREVVVLQILLGKQAVDDEDRAKDFFEVVYKTDFNDSEDDYGEDEE